MIAGGERRRKVASVAHDHILSAKLKRGKPLLVIEYQNAIFGHWILPSISGLIPDLSPVPHTRGWLMRILARSKPEIRFSGMTSIDKSQIPYLP